MPNPLHKNLRKLVGQHYRYLSEDWILIDILPAEDSVVLQQAGHYRTGQLQTDQYGHARRRVPETLTLPISCEQEPETYSDELMLLFQGKI